MAPTEFKWTETLSKCIPNIVRNVDKVAVLIKSIKKRRLRKIDAKKMKIGFWVEQCMHALFKCLEDVNEITKNHIKVVSGELQDFFVLAKNDFRGYVKF